jgi:transposase
LLVFSQIFLCKSTDYGKNNNCSLADCFFNNCPHCGLVLDRDHNAAINILALGLQRISAGSPDVAVEAPAFRHGE